MALGLLLQRRDQAVAVGLARGSSLSKIAGDVEIASRGAIQAARQLSRIAGISRLESEAAALGFSLADRSSRLVADATHDLVRARRAARSYASRWLGKARGDTGAGDAGAAGAATRGSVERIAATESAEAFNGGRAKRLRTVEVRSLMRVWDASLDKRTCPICFSTDGTIVSAREPFPVGEPGAIHPFCRCSFTLITATEAESVLTLQAA